MACSCSRRDFLARGLYGIGVGAGLPMFVSSRTSAALTAQALQGTSIEKHPERILVVARTVRRQRRPEHRRAARRPGVLPRAAAHLGIPTREVHQGQRRLRLPPVDGRLRAALSRTASMAVVHGCGYDHPSFSHFSSMSYWHTGVPNGGEPLGWLGRLADDHYNPATRNLIVNIGDVAVARRPQRQAFAARVRRSGPLPPRRHRRREARARRAESSRAAASNPTLDFLAATARNAADSSDFVRQASAAYRTPVDYGIGNAFGGGLQRVAALIAAGMPTRLYYVAYQGNSFDTHVQQARPAQPSADATADAVRAFMDDIARIGRARRRRGDDVHGVRAPRRRERQPRHRSRHRDADVPRSAKHVKGGFYGQPPSLTDLDDGNLKMTTDFRRVYATAISGVARLRRHRGRAQRAASSRLGDLRVSTPRPLARIGPRRRRSAAVRLWRRTRRHPAASRSSAACC